MAATGKTPILLYGSTTATNQPSAGNLTNSSDGCEIAINVADKNLFFKDATNTVNTVPIRQSSASSDGWLSSADWSTFNSKQPAGSYLTSVTVDSPLTGAGTSGSHLSIPAASGSTNGYLTSTDWTTFNSKQAALGYTPVNKAGDTMTGSLTAPSFIPSSSTVPANGLYLPSANTFGLAANSTALASGTSTAFSVLAGKTLRLNRSDNATYNEISYGASDKFLFNQANGGTYSFAVSGTQVAAISAVGELSGTSVNVSSSTSSVIGVHADNTNAGYSGTLNYLTATRAASASFDFIGAYANSVAQFRVDGAGNTITTGNFVVGTSGKGIDFSATAGTGTSELLADYEEGTWTPTQGAGLIVVGSFSSSGTYTKVGRQVTVIGNIVGSTSVATSSGGVMVNGLPYTPATYCEGTAANVAGTSGSILFINSSTSIYSVSVIAATTNIRFAATYFV